MGIGACIVMLIVLYLANKGKLYYILYFLVILFLLWELPMFELGDDWSFPWWFWVFVVFCVLLGISSEITDREVKKEREKFLKEIERKHNEKKD